jgi:arginyl-tRNA synthetase
MQHLKEKLQDQISQFGDGETEFNTRDIQYLLERIDELEKTHSVIDYLGNQNKGLHHNRIDENLAMKEYDWNNPEKTFAHSWRSEAKHLETLLSNNNLNLKIKVTNEIRVSVATVMQWLGSNIGWEFLNSTLKKEGYKIVKITDDASGSYHIS